MSELDNIQLESAVDIKLEYIESLTEHLCNELGGQPETQSEAVFAYMLREQVEALNKLKEVAFSRLV